MSNLKPCLHSMFTAPQWDLSRNSLGRKGPLLSERGDVTGTISWSGVTNEKAPHKAYTYIYIYIYIYIFFFFGLLHL